MRFCDTSSRIGSLMDALVKIDMSREHEFLRYQEMIDDLSLSEPDETIIKLMRQCVDTLYAEYLSWQEERENA